MRTGLLTSIIVGLAVAHDLAIAASKAAPNTPAVAPIVFAASNDNSLPLSEFRENKLVNGIVKNLGDAIAAELHRKAEYIVVPRKRLDGALQSGAVDGVCYDRPEWVTVPLNWSQAVITNEILLVSAPGTAKPAKLEDVAGKTIGLVLGYQYPELDALGNNYLREDAPNVPSNTKKLMAGRVPYAVIDRLSLMYQEKLNPQIGPIAYLPITRIHAACGFSPASKIPFDEVNQAISRVINDGTVERILARYR